MKVSTLLSAACCTHTAFAAFDYNRAGAVLKAPSGDSFRSVTGSFTVPSLSGDNRLSIWVGIGDSTTQTYILGGGITFNKTLSSWTAFFPDPATDTSDSVPVAAGDNITVNVNIEAGAGGFVTIDNKSRNRTSTRTVRAPANADPEKLTAMVADWWVQAYQVIPGELVQMPNFSTISIRNCAVSTVGGVEIPLANAGAFEIQGTSGQMWTKTTIQGNEVRVTSQGVCQAPGC